MKTINTYLIIVAIIVFAVIVAWIIYVSLPVPAPVAVNTNTTNVNTNATVPANTNENVNNAPAAIAPVVTELPPINAAPPATFSIATSSTKGSFLVGGDGMSLYVKAGDKNTSSCNDGCATVWPPLIVTGSAVTGTGITGKVGTITRDDGTTQVTYNGAPLYFFSGDYAPGDTNGDGYNNIWSLARP